MANAAVLKTPRVIQTDNLSGLSFDLDGFLIKFKFRDIAYRHVEKENFLRKDAKNPSLSAGYFQELKFLEYLSGNLRPELLSTYGLPKEGIKYGVSGDLIKVQRLIVETPFTTFCKVGTYSFAYDGIPENVLDANFDIRIPPGAGSTEGMVPNLSTVAIEFYNLRILLVNNITNPDEKKNAAYTIAKIALIINMINRDIFPMFMVDPDNLSEFVSSQNNEWRSGNIFNNPSLIDLDNYFKNIHGFYKVAYSYQYVILESSGIEKLYWLAMALSADNLSILPTDYKIKLLAYLAKNELSKLVSREQQERLVVNLALSFNLNNINEVDPFLDALIDSKKSIEKGKTLYQTLYSFLSTSTKIVEGIYVLSKWVFNTEFKPTKTKEEFVRAIYALWEYSRYSPYNSNQTVKPNTIAFKEQAPGRQYATFTYLETPVVPYYYSYETAYDTLEFATGPNYTGPPLFVHKVVRPTAAPILLPYESKKFFGLFFDDFTFKFQNSKIRAYRRLAYNYRYLTDEDPTHKFPIAEFDDVLYGEYNIYQPVSVLSYNLETTSALTQIFGETVEINGQNINSFIPLFVLEFIDSSANRQNAENLIGFTADVAGTFSGIGNLPKLRHLRWAATGVESIGLFTIEGLSLTIGTVTFAYDVLALFTDFDECTEGDDFCYSMKAFIMALSLASLTLDGAKTLANISLQKKSSDVLKIVGGVDETTIKQNLRNKLGEYSSREPETIIKTANAIYESGYLYSFPANIVAAIEKRIKNVFKNTTKFVLRPAYTDAFLDEFIRLGDELNLDEKTIADLVFAANRKSDTKYLSPSELIRQTNFYSKKIKVRKFPAGFDDLAQYESFCSAFKTKFLQNLESLSPELADIFVNMKFVVKGSAVRTWKIGDPDLSGIPLPLKQADDIDIGIVLTKRDYNLFTHNLNEWVKSSDNTFNSQLRLKINYSSKVGKLQYDEIFQHIKIGNSNFSQLIVDATQPYTRFVPVNGKGKIGFAVVVEDGGFDNLPELPFK